VTFQAAAVPPALSLVDPRPSLGIQQPEYEIRPKLLGTAIHRRRQGDEDVGDAILFRTGTPFEDDDLDDERGTEVETGSNTRVPVNDDADDEDDPANSNAGGDARGTAGAGAEDDGTEQSGNDDDDGDGGSNIPFDIYPWLEARAPAVSEESSEDKRNSGKGGAGSDDSDEEETVATTLSPLKQQRQRHSTDGSDELHSTSDSGAGSSSLSSVPSNVRSVRSSPRQLRSTAVPQTPSKSSRQVGRTRRSPTVPLTATSTEDSEVEYDSVREMREAEALGRFPERPRRIYTGTGLSMVATWARQDSTDEVPETDPGEPSPDIVPQGAPEPVLPEWLPDVIGDKWDEGPFPPGFPDEMKYDITLEELTARMAHHEDDVAKQNNRIPAFPGKWQFQARREGEYPVHPPWLLL
jgi:hypothetical protein